MSRIKKLICLVMVLVLVFALSGCNDNKTKREEKTEEEITVVELNTVNLNDMLADYNRNSIAAEETYFGNVYSATVTVNEFTPSNNGIECSSGYRINGDYPNSFFAFNLYFNDSQRDYVLGLSVGDTISFKGTLYKYSTLVFGPTLYFEDVVFIDE